ncbi:MAG: type II toxin-antitoxin system MqsR family toxin [Eggerthellaceae bacterium]|nr:type II toxin-antitoxin system MqsR family toxin [Eggerthellaceae bacterium]
MEEAANRKSIEVYLALLQKVTMDTFILTGLDNAGSKNARCMIELGYDTNDVLNVLQDLTVQNYSQGPLPDKKGRPHDLWVFGKIIEGTQIYIKFTAFFEENAVTAICVSFHEAEHEMNFPYKEA